MGERNMEKDKPKYKDVIGEIFIILLVIASLILLIAQTVINVMDIIK